MQVGCGVDVHVGYFKTDMVIFIVRDPYFHIQFGIVAVRQVQAEFVKFLAISQPVRRLASERAFKTDIDEFTLLTGAGLGVG